jgi:hypothetical protein
LIVNHKFNVEGGARRIEINCRHWNCGAEAAVNNRDWAEIENELNGLVPGRPKGDKKTLRNHDARKAIRTDEQALLAHIAAALVQERQY